MSESNNVKNNKSHISFIIIIIYIVISIIVTSYSIYFYKKNNISAFKYYSYKLFGNKAIENEDNELIDTIKFIDNDKQIDRVSLSDRYWINNITFNEIKDDIGDVVYVSEDGSFEEKFIELTYYEIEGLKNKDVQNKINLDIKNHVYNELDEAYEYIDKKGKENINNIAITAYIDGSYSDILSLYITKSINLKNDDDYENNIDNPESEYAYLNYRLDTGDYITFSDCFTKDASIKNIISKTFYKQRAWYYSYNIENSEEYTEEDFQATDEEGNIIYGINMDRREYGTIEDDILKLMYEYEKNKDNIKFSLSEIYLNASLDEYNVYIPMYEFYEYIDVAKKFVSDDSLYEDGNLDKINYMYTVPVSSTFKYFDYITSNKFMAVQNQEMMWRGYYKINYIENDSYEYNGIDENESNRLIDKLKSYLNENEDLDNDKGYIYYIYIYKDFDYKFMDKYYFDIDRIEINIKDFKENVQNINYSILNNISEGYVGVYNLDEKELKEYNLYEYKVKEDDLGNLYIEEYEEQ